MLLKKKRTRARSLFYLKDSRYMFHLHLRRSVLWLPHAEEKLISGTWNKLMKKYIALEIDLAREALGFGLCS